MHKEGGTLVPHGGSNRREKGRRNEVDRTERTLRITIDGLWTAADFAECFRSTEDIYNLFTAMDGGFFRARRVDFPLSRLDRRALRSFLIDPLEQAPLRVAQVRYGSVGTILIAGFGSIGGLTAAFAFLLNRKEESRGRKLDNDLKDFNLQQQRRDRAYLEERREIENGIKDGKARAELTSLQLDNVQKTTALHGQSLNLTQHDLTHLLRDAGIATRRGKADENEMIFRWLENKMLPLSDMVNRGKIIRAEALDGEEGSSDPPTSE